MPIPELTLIVLPTNPSTPSPVELIVSASSSARWSAHKMTFHCPPSLPKFSSRSSSSDSPVRDTETGVPDRSVTAKEQVASNPTPLTRAASTPDSFKIFWEHLAKADQMSEVDCSKIR